MDILAHALYGPTVCSRNGIAGGLQGCKKPILRDWTVWTAMLFGILPDIVSMGVPYFCYFFSDVPDNFFHNFDGYGIVLYRYMHSLICALFVSCVLCLIRKSLFVPSLAWVVHILMDAFTHNLGKFRTTLFYPVSDWAFSGGIPWWHSHKIVLAYWAGLPVIWLFLIIWRWQSRTRSAGQI